MSSRSRCGLSDVTNREPTATTPLDKTSEAEPLPYNAPGTGPAPWQVYRVAAHTVVGVATAEPYGAARWQF